MPSMPLPADAALPSADGSSSGLGGWFSGLFGGDAAQPKVSIHMFSVLACQLLRCGIQPCASSWSGCLRAWLQSGRICDEIQTCQQESAPPTDLSEDQFKPPPMPAELQGSETRFR